MLKAKLLAKIKLAKDINQFDFEILDGELKFTAGQYLSLRLPQLPARNNEGNVRYFSLVSSPEETKKFSLATKLSTSPFKQALFGLALNAEVEIGSISGSLILADNDAPLVFIAGGMGITPFMSLLGEAAKQNPIKPLTFFYSNRSRPATAYYDELVKIFEEQPTWQIIFTMTDDEYWSGEKRLLDYEFIKEQVPDYKNAKFLVAGPPGFVLSIVNNFDRLGILRDNYLLEEFIGY